MKVIYEPRGAAREYAPLAVNLMVGCRGGCKYPCYGPGAARVSREAWATPRVRKDILRHLEDDCQTVLREKLQGPVFLSFLCDPFSSECVETTAEAIRILYANGIPCRTLTKFPSFATCVDPVLLKSVDFGVTLAWYDTDAAKAWEPNCDSPLNRMIALRELHRRGVRTWVSMEPVIEPAQALKVLELAGGDVDVWRIGRWNHDARSHEIDWTGFLRDALDAIPPQADYQIKDALWAHADDAIKARWPKERLS